MLSRLRNAELWTVKELAPNVYLNLKKENVWEISDFPLISTMTRSLTLFPDTFAWSLNSAGRDAEFFRIPSEVSRQKARKYDDFCVACRGYNMFESFESNLIKSFYDLKVIGKL